MTTRSSPERRSPSTCVPPDSPSAPAVRWGVARTVGAGLIALAAVAILVPNWIWGPGFVVLLAAGVILYLLIRVVRDDGASHLSGVAARIAIGIVLLALAVGGFTAAGIPQTEAVAATFTARLFTSYLPPIWGWFALQWLRRNEYV